MVKVLISNGKSEQQSSSKKPVFEIKRKYFIPRLVCDFAGAVPVSDI